MGLITLIFWTRRQRLAEADTLTQGFHRMRSSTLTTKSTPSTGHGNLVWLPNGTHQLPWRKPVKRLSHLKQEEFSSQHWAQTPNAGYLGMCAPWRAASVPLSVLEENSHSQTQGLPSLKDCSSVMRLLLLQPAKWGCSLGFPDRNARSLDVLLFSRFSEAFQIWKPKQVTCP